MEFQMYSLGRRSFSIMPIVLQDDLYVHAPHEDPCRSLRGITSEGSVIEVACSASHRTYVGRRRVSQIFDSVLRF